MPTASRKAVVQKNGDVIRLAPGDPEKIDEVRVGRLVLDGDMILPADGATVGERRRISVNGLITVALAVGRDGALAGTPNIRPFGVPVEEDRDDFIADATDSAGPRLRARVGRGEGPRGGPAGGPPLRDRLDRQEAAGRGDADQGRLTMKWTSIVAIYFLFFVASAFVLLPFGVKTDEEAGNALVPGQAESAPHQFHLPRHLLRARRLAVVLFALYYVNWANGWITADDLDFYN